MKYLLFFVLSIVFNFVEAQELYYELNSASGNMSNQASKLNWAFGELLMFDISNDETLLTTPWLTSDLINMVVSNGDFVLYPNPSSEFVNICVDTYTSLPFKLHVYNINGEKIFDKEITSNHEPIPLSNISRGMYFFEYVKDGKRIGMNKMLKE